VTAAVSDRFDIRATSLAGLTLIQRKPAGDSRGYLDRLFCLHELQEVTAGRAIVQVNHTLTARRGTVRGLHAQRPPHAEAKFVTCLRGEVFDAAVDIRAGSPTFLGWHAEILSARNHKTLMIPEGFAHGFQTLTDECELLYLHTAAHHPEAECCLNVRDPRLGIRWPETIVELSPRDAGHPLLTKDFSGVVV
jgi:dTDP-4-dehydrorhamnose 3,5-epimerase